jgi:addiction module HigA family antidote
MEAKPVHPGDFLRSEIIDALGLSVREAAAVLGVARQSLSLLLNGHVSLTPEMGLRFEKAFGLSMDTLVRMQASFDIAQARARADQIKLAPYIPSAPAAEQPVLL